MQLVSPLQKCIRRSSPVVHRLTKLLLSCNHTYLFISNVLIINFVGQIFVLYPVEPPSKIRKFIYRDKFSRFVIPIQIQGETGATLKYSGVYGTVTGIARNEGAR